VENNNALNKKNPRYKITANRNRNCTMLIFSSSKIKTQIKVSMAENDIGMQLMITMHPELF